MRSLHFALARKHAGPSDHIMIRFVFLYSSYHFSPYIFNIWWNHKHTTVCRHTNRPTYTCIWTHANITSCAYCTTWCGIPSCYDGACTKHFLLLLYAVLCTIIMINWWFSCSLQSMDAATAREWNNIIDNQCPTVERVQARARWWQSKRMRND